MFKLVANTESKHHEITTKKIILQKRILNSIVYFLKFKTNNKHNVRIRVRQVYVACVLKHTNIINNKICFIRSRVPTSYEYNFNIIFYIDRFTFKGTHLLYPLLDITIVQYFE